MMRASSVRAGWLRAWPRQVAVALFVIGVLLPVHSFAAALAGPAASGEHMAQLVVGVVLLKVALIVHAILFALIPSLPLAPPAGQGLAPSAALPASGPWSRAEAGAVVCILVLGAALRIPSLGRGLWFDEIQTYVDYVRLPLVHIVSTFDSQNQHLLYSILARISDTSFSAWVTIPSASGIVALSLGGPMITSRSARIASSKPGSSALIP